MNNTSEKIRIESITKVFGPSPTRALPLIDAGLSKLAILEKTGLTVGLRDISLSIPEGKIFVIMGLSGSGKSTLIRHINRLIEPTKGRILVDGDNVLDMDPKSLETFRRHKVSMIFQKFGLLPHKTILENIGFGLKIRGVDKKERHETSSHWLNKVGLDGYANVRPRQLSGGMQQRVGLARALATDPEILLMDEPFGALDPLIRRDMQDQLLDLQETLGKTIVFITHDLDEALKLGHQIAIFKDGEISQAGLPSDIILHPKNDYVKAFARDIYRGKYLKARALMEEHAGSLESGRLTIHPDDTLESLLPHIYKDQHDFLIVAQDGDVKGAISKKVLLDTLANTSEKSAYSEV